MAERLREYTAQLAAQQKTTAFYQYLWLLAKHAGKSLAEAAIEAERFSLTSPDVARVLKSAVAIGSTADATWAGALSGYSSLTSAWVHSIAETTLLGQLDFVRVPARTRTIIEVTGASAGWVAPGAPAPMSRLTLTSSTALPEKKIVALIAFTEELLAAWGPATLANLKDSVDRSVRLALDASLLDPSLDANAARPASLTNGITPLTSSGSTAAQVTADLKALLQSLLDGGSPDLSRAAICMSPTTALYLSQLLTAAGAFAFPNLGATGGEIWKVPVLVSTAADLGGSPHERVIAAVDAARLIVADDGLVLAESSDAATLQFSDTPVDGAANGISLFQTHTRALRLTLFKNYERATLGAVAWMSVGY